jgi:S1-C subfamily serine protease
MQSMTSQIFSTVESVGISKMKIRFNLTIWMSLFLLAFVCWSGQPVHGQELNDELRKLFLEIKGEFDPDIEKKIDIALEMKTDRIRFNADELERFRSNPINPFEGLEHIDLGTLKGNIELKFEIPTVRNRKIGNNERQTPGVLATLSSISATNAASIVEIINGQEVVCLGTVVDNRGFVLTKLSEVNALPSLRIRDHKRVIYAAKLGPRDEANDLVLLETVATELPPLSFSDRQPSLGEFLVTGDATGNAIAVGSYSHTPRSLAESEKGFLGVTPRNRHDGVEITEVSPGSAAEAAGLCVGDVIRSANGKPMMDVSTLVAEVQRSKAGQQMVIEYLRGTAASKTTVTLAGMNLSPERAARFKMMNRLGAIPSARATDLPWVFQHDSPLFPEQCGGPIMDLDGNVIGINIARQGRVASLAIPSAQVKTILDTLKCESVASRKE